MTDSSPASKPKIHWPTFWLIFGLVSLTVISFKNATAKEIFGTTGKMVFSLISTPFILETTSILLFIFAVAMINRWRRHRDASDWVCMPVEDAHAEVDSLALEVGLQNMRQSLQDGNYEEALSQLRSLPSFPNDSSNMLSIVEILAKSFKIDESVDILNLHRKAYVGQEYENQRQALQNNISLWLTNHRSDEAADLLPRWHQLLSLRSTP